MDEVKVEQVDRQAAVSGMPSPIDEALRKEVMSGEWDHRPLVQSYAKHRLASQPVPASDDLVERVARALCEADGCDPDKEIIANQAAGFENFGPLWQANERSGNQLGGRNYVADARAIIPIVREAEREGIATWLREQAGHAEGLVNLTGRISAVPNRIVRKTDSFKVNKIGEARKTQ